MLVVSDSRERGSVRLKGLVPLKWQWLILHTHHFKLLRLKNSAIRFSTGAAAIFYFESCCKRDFVKINWNINKRAQMLNVFSAGPPLLPKAICLFAYLSIYVYIYLSNPPIYRSVNPCLSIYPSNKSHPSTINPTDKIQFAWISDLKVRRLWSILWWCCNLLGSSCGSGPQIEPNRSSTTSHSENQRRMY